MKHHLIFLFLVLVVLNGCSNKPFVQIGDAKIFVEIADDQDEQAQGLMFRKELCENCGMLFVFPASQQYSFWMKNTLIPLDMIFIDETRTVVDVLSAEPCAEDPCPPYTPRKEARYVLEVNAGVAELSGIDAGRVADFTRTFK